VSKALKTIEDLVSRKTSRVDNRRLAESLIDQFNGLGGLAKEVKLEYDAAPTGSVAKSRLLIAVFALLNQVAQAEGDVDVSGDMDTEELASVLKGLATEGSDGDDQAVVSGEAD
jgi:hypothetical protein